MSAVYVSAHCVPFYQARIENIKKIKFCLDVIDEALILV